MPDSKLSALAALAVEMANTDEIYLNDGGVSKRQLYSVFKAAFALDGHSIASHDTDTTGAELTALADNSTADGKHWHSKLVASDGSPDPAVRVDSIGLVSIGPVSSTTFLTLSSGSDKTELTEGLKIDRANRAGHYIIINGYDARANYIASLESASMHGIHIFKSYDGTTIKSLVTINGQTEDMTVEIGNLIIGTAGKGIDMSGGPKILFGTGTPEGAVVAAVGSIYMRSSGGAGTSLYVKESGSGNTGWIGK